MPVIATPIVVTPPAGQSTCVGQMTPSVPLTKIDGCTILGKRTALQIVQGQTASLSWTLIDSNGNPVDLSTCGAFPEEATEDDQSQVLLRIRESLIYPAFGDDPVTEVRGVVSNAVGGTVLFPLTATATKYAGIYLAEAGVYTAGGLLAFSNQFYVIVNRGLHGLLRAEGPPTLAEIRLYLRDNHGRESSLLEDVEWDAAEIAFAIERPISYWNEAPPPIPQTFTTTSFPARYHWLEGITGQLYIMAASWYRRNHLSYSAAGIAVDDRNKSAEYEQIGQLRWRTYTEWVKLTKVRINMENFCGGLDSPYLAPYIWGS